MRLLLTLAVSAITRGSTADGEVVVEYSTRNYEPTTLGVTLRCMKDGEQLIRAGLTKLNL